jgi:glycine/D-amino acid oxidase-like deaminating enzyme
MSGVLTAYHILHSQQSSTSDSAGKPPTVLLLDARDLCSGATARNGGHAKIKTSTLAGLKDGKERIEMQGYVLRVMAELKSIVDGENGLGEECEFEMRRSFDVYCDQAELEGVKRVYDEDRKSGEEWVKQVSYLGPDMVENVTSIKGAVGAFSSPCVSFWPYKFVTGLLARMVHRYARLINVQTNTPVTSVSNDHILTTPRGSVKARKIVFATNAWTPGILPSYADTITPIKGMASHHTPQRPIHPQLNNTYNIHFPPNLSTGRATGVDYLNPRPNGSIVVGGGGWLFKPHLSSWWDNFDDSTHFPPSVEAHWESYMQSNFLDWENSRATPDYVWTGIMGHTSDGMPHVGRVVGEEGEEVKGQWMLAGFNGGGMALIAVAARAVARMVLVDLGFEGVKEEFGLLEGFGTGVGRMGKENKI